MPDVSMVCAGFALSAADAVVDELRQLGAVDADREARVGAELARAEHERIDETLRDGRAARGQRVRQQEHRVDAAHFGVDRDRLGAARRDAASATCRPRANR